MQTRPFENEIVSLIPILRSYALALTGSEHRAEDLVQDTLERGWRSQDTFLQGASMKGWLVRIMQNRAIDVHRVDKWTIEDVDGLHAAMIKTLPAQFWALQYAELIVAIKRLPPPSSEALSLVFFAGLTHQEAAAVLGCPLGSLKSRIRRAREDLRLLINLQEDEEIAR